MPRVFVKKKGMPKVQGTQSDNIRLQYISTKQGSIWYLSSATLMQCCKFKYNIQLVLIIWLG
jgi:hypothetical protein